jgi:hypothetical protein
MFNCYVSGHRGQFYNWVDVSRHRGQFITKSYPRNLTTQYYALFIGVSAPLLLAILHLKIHTKFLFMRQSLAVAYFNFPDTNLCVWLVRYHTLALSVEFQLQPNINFSPPCFSHHPHA